jgi:hypothetical protein
MKKLHLPVIKSYTLSCKFISLHMLLVAVESSYNVICFTALPDLFCWEITHEFDPGKDDIQVIVTIFFNILIIFLHFLFMFRIVHPDQVRMLSVVLWVGLWPSPVTPHRHCNMFFIKFVHLGGLLCWGGVCCDGISHFIEDSQLMTVCFTYNSLCSVNLKRLML